MSADIGTDLHRRIAAAKDFEELQGLRTAGMGLVFVVVSLVAPESSFWMIALGIVLTNRLSGAWYGRRYGRRVQASGDLEWVLLIVMVPVLIMLLSEFEPPEPLVAVVAGVSFLLLQLWGQRHVGVGPWTWIAGGGLILYGILGLADVVTVTTRTTFVALGLTLVVMGVADHRRLMQLVGPGARE